MQHDVLLALWFLLPAGLANVAPILSNIVPGFNCWNARMDGDAHFRGKELLGAHKTWRGLLSGMVVSTLIFWLQKEAVGHYNWAQTIANGVPYRTLPILILGPLFGLGALGGDAVESFFKRQRGVVSGGRWVPYDQIDYIIGGVVVTLPFVILSWATYLWIFILWFGLHLLASYVGWLLQLKEQPI